MSWPRHSPREGSTTHHEPLLIFSGPLAGPTSALIAALPSLPSADRRMMNVAMVTSVVARVHAAG